MRESQKAPAPPSYIGVFSDPILAFSAIRILAFLVNQMHFIYELTMSDGGIYIGRTSNLPKRMWDHYNRSYTWVQPVSHRILDSVERLEDARDLEWVYIQLLQPKHNDKLQSCRPPARKFSYEELREQYDSAFIQ